MKNIFKNDKKFNEWYCFTFFANLSNVRLACLNSVEFLGLNFIKENVASHM